VDDLSAEPAQAEEKNTTSPALRDTGADSFSDWSTALATVLVPRSATSTTNREAKGTARVMVPCRHKW
jgi:hypothetical protein